jgi:hypothetical protein
MVFVAAVKKAWHSTGNPFRGHQNQQVHPSLGRNFRFILPGLWRRVRPFFIFTRVRELP